MSYILTTTSTIWFSQGYLLPSNKENKILDFKILLNCAVLLKGEILHNILTDLC